MFLSVIIICCAIDKCLIYSVAELKRIKDYEAIKGYRGRVFNENIKSALVPEEKEEVTIKAELIV